MKTEKHTTHCWQDFCISSGLSYCCLSIYPYLNHAGGFGPTNFSTRNLGYLVPSYSYTACNWSNMADSCFTLTAISIYWLFCSGLSSDPNCPPMLMEKTGRETTSGHHHSQALAFSNDTAKHQESYMNNMSTKYDNSASCTPRDVLEQMGPDYSLFKDNCQDGASRAIQHCNK